MSFPRYEKCKKSGVAWLGEVPEHWVLLTGRRLFREAFESSWPTDEQLSATQKYGVIPQKLFMEKEEQKVVLALRGLEAFKHVEVDDFIISLRSFQGGIEKSHYQGCVSTAYTVLRSLREIAPSYWMYLFKSDAFISVLRSVTDGIREGKSISYAQFAQILLPIPPPSEQEQIAEMLAQETAKIDALIEEQRRLIALLKEKRQAVLSHAVTKGLNPAAPMKDSGIEWIGQVPTHWRVGKCGRHIKILPGFAFPSADFSHDANDTRLLRGINVAVGCLRWDETVFWKRSANDGLDAFEVNIGDIVLGMDRPLISEGIRVAKVGVTDLPCLLLQRVALLRTDSQLNTDFFMRLLSSPMFVAHFSPETSGVSVPHISPEQIGSFVIPLPDIEEQAAIIKFVERETTKCDALVSESQQAIDLLQERRSALISAAVTGKIDVRNNSPRETPSHEEVYEPA